jgi:hypothetical protein
LILIPDKSGRLSLRFKFHSGASLLIVSGLPGEVEVARKVVLALPETSSSKAQSVSVDDATKAVFLRRYGTEPREHGAAIAAGVSGRGYFPADPTNTKKIELFSWCSSQPPTPCLKFR